ncbi:cupin domain-containing protein [Roseibium aggregatum]|uniref:Cupin domain-containing protein n=1 Tax=Roseibium aggregatum TaxID=187304 RepID=A0A926NZC0_9HYPH|nr:cupin domain-containing protein [Roseibium aggregatum]MBD1547066.1 cupin domain-containing protein [Roseibium aggregatum]
MPKIDIGSIPVRSMTIYPEPYAKATEGREKQALGDAANLTQFGVNLTRLKPGAGSALKHWHENEDEFVFILEGEAVLEEGDSVEILKAGEAAGFKAGAGLGHRLLNKSDRDLVYLEVGTRASAESVHYTDADLHFERINQSKRLMHKDGTPY